MQNKRETVQGRELGKYILTVCKKCSIMKI